MVDIRKDRFPKVTVILRGYTSEQARCIAHCMVGTRLQAVEVAMNTYGAREIISELVTEFGTDIMIGAGSVTTPARARDAAAAGATFALSPVCFTEELFEICKERGMLAIPSGFTPTEIWRMFEMGADIVKIFPAHILDDAYIKDLQAPLGALHLMVVGGVDADNCQRFFENGAFCVGIGSGMFRNEDVVRLDEAAIRRSIERFEMRVAW